MFKSKLIENENYYKLKNRQTLLMLLPAIPMGLLINFYKFPVWLTVIMFALYMALLFLLFKNGKRLNAVSDNKLIEIDESEIRIITKNGKEQEVINLAEVEKLILKEEYVMATGSVKELGEEIAGKTKQDYLILQQNKQKRQLNFEIESHYMAKQLNKIIDIWKTRGYNIECSL